MEKLMSEYVIYTDSACDIAPEILEKWGVLSQSLTFRFDGEGKEYKNGDMPEIEFYQKMRDGGVAKTAAVNSETFLEAFEEILKDGKDLLYIGFSSGLSTTFNSARLAAKEFSERYPERKIEVVDSLCASAGQGLAVYLAVEKKREGANLSETAEYIRKNILSVCHWFTVDDLVYLKRGGRISAASALFGNALGIKPLMHVDNEGHLVEVAKIRGRKNAIVEMANKYGELAKEPGRGPVFISHGDCERDVEALKTLLADRYGANVDIVTYVGPVIGAHSGPGTLALFFIGKDR